MNVGDLEVWWIPQIPGEPFCVPVADVHEAVKLLDTLARYDAFQFEHRIKPDYCNVGGLRRWCDDDGDGFPGWEDWYDETTGEDDPRRWDSVRMAMSAPDEQPTGTADGAR